MREFWPGIALMTLSTVAGAQTSQSVRDLSTPLAPTDEVTIMQALSGG